MISFLRKSIPQNFFLRRWYSIMHSYMAAIYYGFPGKNMIAIGITGTDGKTTTTELIAHILRKADKKVLSITTAQIQIDQQNLPISKRTTPSPWVLQKLLRQAASRGIDYLVIEVSSHALSQKRIFGLKFQASVLTNITREHLDYHNSLKQYQLTKKRLFTHYLSPNGGAVLNADDPAGRAWSHDFAKKGIQVMSYGIEKRSKDNWNAEEIINKSWGTEFTIHDNIHNSYKKIELPMYGLFNVSNALAAIQASTLVGIDINECVKNIKTFPGISGRMEKIEMGQDFLVFVDFAITPGAFEKLLKTAKKLAKNKEIILVFGSPGTHPDKKTRQEIGEVAANQADTIIITDDEPYFENPNHIRLQILEGAQKSKKASQKHILEIPDRRQAIISALKKAKKGDVVIISGMGHLKQRNINGKEINWNDAQVIRESLSSLGFKNYNNSLNT